MEIQMGGRQKRPRRKGFLHTTENKKENRVKVSREYEKIRLTNRGVRIIVHNNRRVKIIHITEGLREYKI